MSVNSQVNLQLQVTHSAAYDLAPAAVKAAIAAVTKSLSWESGTGANQADLLFSDTRTLTASATEDLDLAGVLTDAFGATLTFARIKLIYVCAAAANNVANNVNVTRPAANGVPLFLAAGDGIALAPGQFFLWVGADAIGKAVTAATGDLLTITNSAGTNSVTYDVIIVGASA
jgi:hypothetical protein